MRFTKEAVQGVDLTSGVVREISGEVVAVRPEFGSELS